MVTRGEVERGSARKLNRALNSQLYKTGDCIEVAKNNRGNLVELAAQASLTSPHYDGVTRFGAATLALAESEDHGPYFILIPSSNRSSYHGADKSCAEMGAEALIRWHNRRTEGNLLVIAMALYGPSDSNRIREITGTDGFYQCPPCHDCLDRLACNPAFMSDTEVILANSLCGKITKLGNLVNQMAMVPRPAASGELIAA